MKNFFYLLLLLSCFTTHAALIIVDNAQDLALVDGNCDLRDAIRSADQNTSFDNCNAGQPDTLDLIIIQVAGPIQLNSTLHMRSSMIITTPINADPVEILGATNDRVLRFAPLSESDNDLTLINLIIKNGNAPNQLTGGGILFSGVNTNLGAIELSGMTFDNNHGYSGGAIHFDVTQAESIYIYNSVFTNNSADTIGGAIYGLNMVNASTENGSLRILRSHFEQNSAATAGAVFLRGENIETAEINDSQFINNSASERSGAVELGALNTDQTFYLDRNLFMFNTANGDSGALQVGFASIVYVRDSLFAFNSAQRGGAVTSLTDDALLRLSNSTLVHNSASVAGDNIYIFGTGRIIPSRNIIAYPVNGDNCTGNLGTSVPANVMDNIADDNTCELLASVPFTLLADPKLTGFSEHDDLFPGFAPTVDSPALDITSFCGEKDVMERDRPIDGNGSGTAVCDVGGIESPANIDIIWSDAFGI
jgi:predicted outer membrane repeat protein